MYIIDIGSNNENENCAKGTKQDYFDPSSHCNVSDAILCIIQ